MHFRRTSRLQLMSLDLCRGCPGPIYRDLPVGECLFPARANQVIRHASGDLLLDADDIAVATWAFQHGAIAGYDTDTLHGSRLRYIPLLGAQGVLGIMGIKPGEPEGVITHEQDRILTAFANQTALALERVNRVRTSLDTGTD